jgi:hypothetical protein
MSDHSVCKIHNHYLVAVGAVYVVVVPFAFSIAALNSAAVITGMLSGFGEVAGRSQHQNECFLGGFARNLSDRYAIIFTVHCENKCLPFFHPAIPKASRLRRHDLVGFRSKL